MARKRLEMTKTEIQNNTPGIENDELKKVVENYINNKSEADKYSKLAKAENNYIKKSLTELKLNSFDTDIGSVKLSESRSETFREDDLIALFKKRGLADKFVVTKEVVDFEALESALYHEIFSKEDLKEMDKCKDVNVVTKLLISKKKGD